MIPDRLELLIGRHRPIVLPPTILYEQIECFEQIGRLLLRFFLHLGFFVTLVKCSLELVGRRNNIHHLKFLEYLLNIRTIAQQISIYLRGALFEFVGAAVLCLLLFIIPLGRIDTVAGRKFHPLAAVYDAHTDRHILGYKNAVFLSFLKGKKYIPLYVHGCIVLKSHPNIHPIFDICKDYP